MPVAVLLRPASNRRFIEHHLNGPDQVEARLGSLDDPPSLRAALRDVTHVIHCAGLTRALDAAGFFRGNQAGTRHLVDAVNDHGNAVRRLLLISSLAAGGPATPDRPAREDDPPRPVSAYGASKLGAETEVRTRSRVPWVIVRPPAVYGPRDDGFLPMFRVVRRGVVPRFAGSLAALSMAYAEDLAAAVMRCLTHPAAAHRTYYAASPEVLHGEAFALEIARQMGVRTFTVPLPAAVLWAACLVQQGVSRCTRRPHILGLEKYRELRAPGWVCDASRLQAELGGVRWRPHAEGIGQTLAWYRKQGWL